MRARKHRSDRNGVVLLIILGLMAMFGMVVLAFVLVTGHSKDEAIGLQRGQEYAIVPQEQLHHAALEMLRGSRSPVSGLRPHSLLEDMYGSRATYGDMVMDGVPLLDASGAPVALTATVPLCNGQLIGFTTSYKRTDTKGTPDPSDDSTVFFARRDAYRFVGCVLTMKSGVAAGKSTRIVGHDPRDPANPWDDLLLILPFKGVPTATFVADVQAVGALSAQTRHYIINGTPFSGTGFGYNSSTNPTDHPPGFPVLGGLDARLPILQRDPTDPGNPLKNEPLVVWPGGASVPSLWDTIWLPYALLPNRAGDPSNSTTEGLHGPGHANEEYDAVDYQNMLLAAMEPDGNVPIPSLHRPALINYWFHRVVQEWLVPVVGLTPEDAWRAVLQPEMAGPPAPAGPVGAHGIIDAATRDAIIALKRRIFFRPLSDLHGYFSGSNSVWTAWESQDIFNTAEYPTLTEIRDEYWLGINVRPPTPTRTYLGGVALRGRWDTNGDGQQDGPWWDVDCNGDGQPDAIWVDLGFPVREMQDGRRYKPLFAILCVDMDGRLNVNAHGCLVHTTQDPTSGQVIYAQTADTTTLNAGTLLYGDLATGGSTTASLGRGAGYGPPEVSLLPVLDDDYAQYRALLMGGDIDPNPGRTRWLEGRYGEAGGPLVVDANGDDLPDDPRYVAPGESFRPLPSANRADPTMIASDDPLSRNKGFLISTIGFSPAAGHTYSDFGTPTAFGTPPDLKGSMAVGLDVRGQPIYAPIFDLAVNTLAGGWLDPFAWPGVNDPYELNLSLESARAPGKDCWTPGLSGASRIDHPFNVYELERFLRGFDRDGGGLADRLALLAPNLLNHRNEFTTDSFDVPCPNLNYLRRGPGVGPIRFTHFTQLLRSRLRGGMENRPDFWPDFVPREMLAGLKMNLNRPFGNGRDDNGNGVVDEVAEVFDPSDPGNPALWEMLTLVTASGATINVPMDHCNGVDVDLNRNDANGNDIIDAPDDLALIALDRAQARQLYARYLYVLAILVSGDEIYANPRTLKTSPPWDSERLAQWAVNVVDFIDRDSIMTRFDYDPDPLDGWAVDGTHVVWGCERPELLFTESLAFHDVRTRDLSSDPSGKRTTDTPDPDENFDSFRPPEGNLLLEVYNPWTRTEHLPGEFCYDRSTGSWSPGVRLNQTTPGGDPVFRVLIAMPEGNPSDPDFQPRDPDVPALAPATVERSVYFVQPAGSDPTYGDGASIRYYPSNQAMAPVMPGRYAVIGPGDDTGTGTALMGYQTTDVDWNGSPNPRRVVLSQNTDPNTQQVEVYANDVNNPDSVPAKPAVAVVMDAVTNPQDGTNRRSPRFSVSEPANGYTLLGADAQALDSTTGNWNQPHDEPLDKTTDPALWEATFPDGDTKGIHYQGTNRRFRVAYLQRLANPLAPWHPDSNPYRTVDSIHVDLTVFNGTTSASDPEVLASQHSEFYAVQRGANLHTSTPDNPPVPDDKQRNNIWAAEPEPALAPATPSPPRDVYPEPAPHFYSEALAHTLGRLNAWYGNPRPVGGPDPTGEYLGDSLDTAAADDGPWPWLQWNNRPFVNEMELLLVPNQRSSQLLRHMSVGQESSDPYQPTADTDLSFQHLGTLFGTPPPPPPPGPGGSSPDRATQRYRLLELVHVPSRFVGTEIQTEPRLMGNPPGATPSWWPVLGVDPAPLVAPFSFPFRPPYNGISRYREPGRVNVNTIFSQDVWTGLLGYFPSLTGTATDYWPEFVNVRRGYAPDAGIGNLNKDYPTQFANPVRSSAGVDLVPPMPDPSKAPGDPDENNLLGNVIADGVHATMLRGGTVPHGAGGELPLFAHSSTDTYEDTARNPYFRYQLLQRLAGSTTIRSNVYAVWITVGYFEVLEAGNPGWAPAQYQAVFPEGYQLGAELGTDTGEIIRHRAFYLFDRSIPIGFERGRDNNVEDAILLERFIE